MIENFSNKLMGTIEKLDCFDGLLNCNFGLEKENVRVNDKGELAVSKHPSVFGDKLKNSFIITDFSESQVEMITPVCDTIEESYIFLDNLHDIVSSEIENEYLWPQSMPPILPSDEKIPLAEYSNSLEGIKARKYRERLAKKYGAKRQMISGIHYNFSFKESFLRKIHKGLDLGISYKEFRNQVYLKIARNFIEHGWIINYLMGSSVAVDKSYTCNCPEKLSLLDDHTYELENATSMRNSSCGYKNPEDFLMSYDTVDHYIEELQNYIDAGDISSPAEYYSPIRFKTKGRDNVLKHLKEDGVEYIEIRSIDINPEKKNGLDVMDLKFVHLFVLFTLLNDSNFFDKQVHKTSLINWDNVASCGRNSQCKIILSNGKKEKVDIIIYKVLDMMEALISKLQISDLTYLESIKAYRDSLNSKQVNSKKVWEAIKEKGYVQYHMQKALEYKEISQTDQFLLKGYEDLELSTQILIKEAIKKGITYTILDRKENFIKLEYEEKVEYVKQATKTSLDTYITFLMMENKSVTKKVLEEHGINVPKGREYDHINKALDDFEYFKNKAIVIKPKSTNFGIGITIFKNDFSKEDYDKCLKFAFEKDDSIIIESFVNGKEYRFFVIGDEVVGILHRVPANVKGNGRDSIRQLVEDKNKNPLRGSSYVKPLEKIKIDDSEILFLKDQGLTPESIPDINKVVFLRENSNISTGGDSIDFTDDIFDEYKQEAVRAAKAVDATICGVDMMIEDIHKPFSFDQYSIIELNFNPAIHIHCYPFVGKNRKLGEKILKALDF